MYSPCRGRARFGCAGAERAGCKDRLSPSRPQPRGPSWRALRGGSCCVSKRAEGLGGPRRSAAPSHPKRDRTLLYGQPGSTAGTAGTFQRHREMHRAEKEAQKLPQIFGSGNTEKLLTERHIISLIFKQNSPSIFQNHIEHFRIIDFNGEFCPKNQWRNTAQSKLLLSINIFCPSSCNVKNRLKMCILWFCLFPEMLFESCCCGGPGRLCGPGDTPQRGCARGQGRSPAARSARAPPGAKAPFLGWVLGGPAVRTLCIAERQTGSPLGTVSGPILHRLGEALPSLPFGPKSSCLCRPKQIPDGAGKILSLLNV